MADEIIEKANIENMLKYSRLSKYDIYAAIEILLMSKKDVNEAAIIRIGDEIINKGIDISYLASYMFSLFLELSLNIDGLNILLNNDEKN